MTMTLRRLKIMMMLLMVVFAPRQCSGLFALQQAAALI